MDDWFNVIDAGCELPASAVQDLRDMGFVVMETLGRIGDLAKYVLDV